MDELNSRMERTEGRLNELNDRTIKITQSEQTKADWDSKKRKKKRKGKRENETKQKPSGSRILSIV